ncbi:MAG: arylsulfatase [Bryobacterales bacterium]|nr:arylsulfatase [Bryobacterales bacterium]
MILALLLPAAVAGKPNIVLVMADDLGYGHLGSYGQDRIRTPHLDRLAAEGMRFTQAYAGSTVCAPSRSVLITGLHGGHTSVRGNLGDAHLRDEDVTLAEVLKSAGYATGGYGKWGLGLADSPGHPLRQGFDDFLGYLHQVHAHFFYPFWLTLNHGRMDLPLNRNGGRGQYSHDLIFDRALDFIRENRDGPFFCYLPVTIPHVELAVPADSLAEYLGEFPEIGGGQERRVGYIVSPNPRATYAAMVSRLDRDIGRLVDLLATLGIAEDTIVIFNSDNGAQARFDVSEEFFDATAGLRGYKGSMYEGGLRVPQIVRWPGHVEPGSETDHLTYFPDMMPTFAELAGVEPPSTDGISIVPTILKQGGQRQAEWLYWELISSGNQLRSQAARKGRWKFVRPRMDSPVEVYDLQEDEGETTDLAARHSDLVEEFERWVDENRTEPPDQPARSPVGFRDYVELGPVHPAAMGARNWPKD